MRYIELVVGTPEVLYACIAALVVVSVVAVLVIVRLGRRGEGARLAELADSEVGPAAGLEPGLADLNVEPDVELDPEVTAGPGGDRVDASGAESSPNVVGSLPDIAGEQGDPERDVDARAGRMSASSETLPETAPPSLEPAKPVQAQEEPAPKDSESVSPERGDGRWVFRI